MKKLILLFLILFSPQAFVAEGKSNLLKQGKDYRLVSNTSLKQTETQIYFWYGCNSCFQFMPLLEEKFSHWQKVPISVYKSWRQQTKLFFTLRSLNAPFAIDQKLMAAIHKGDLPANDLYAQKKFIVNTGIDADIFDRHFYSEAVNQQAANSDFIKKQISISKVPSALIGGQYYIDLSMSKNLQQFLANIITLEKMYKNQTQQTEAIE